MPEARAKATGLCLRPHTQKKGEKEDTLPGRRSSTIPGPRTLCVTQHVNSERMPLQDALDPTRTARNTQIVRVLSRLIRQIHPQQTEQEPAAKRPSKVETHIIETAGTWEKLRTSCEYRAQLLGNKRVTRSPDRVGSLAASIADAQPKQMHPVPVLMLSCVHARDACDEQRRLSDNMLATDSSISADASMEFPALGPLIVMPCISCLEHC